MHEQTDEEIAIQVQKGDMEPFRLLVERYEAKMARYAKRFFFRGSDVEDLVQDVFVKAYINIQSFDVDRKFSPWIYRIAHNEFVNAVKKRVKERNNVSLFDFDVLFPHLTAKETADASAALHDIKARIDESLDKLGPKYKEPLILYYFEEMDYKEIAEILHIPVSTVGVRLQRGKVMLQKMIEESERTAATAENEKKTTP